jgi:hypothetical protein
MNRWLNGRFVDNEEIGEGACSWVATSAFVFFDALARSRSTDLWWS